MNLFDRLNQGRPSPVEEKTKDDPAQRMLDFILRWPRESISTSELITYGPRPKKNSEEVLKLATTLEKHGWLTPKSTPRKDMRHWNIVRRPIVHPKIDHRRSDAIL
jgi:hypothetical protein